MRDEWTARQLISMYTILKYCIRLALRSDCVFFSLPASHELDPITDEMETIYSRWCHTPMFFPRLDYARWIIFCCQLEINELDHHTIINGVFFFLIVPSNDSILFLSKFHRRDRISSGKWEFTLWTHQIHQQKYSSVFSIIYRLILCIIYCHNVSCAASVINLIDSRCKHDSFFSLFSCTIDNWKRKKPKSEVTFDQ